MFRIWILITIFLASTLPTFAANVADVVINEAAWMGTATDANDEWIELLNNTSSDIDLTGWTLTATDGTPSITLTGTISADDYFLLERTNDTTVSDITADQIYTGALGNSGEVLVLKDSSDNEIDRVDAWHAGDNSTKATMERIDPQASGTTADNWANNNGATVNGSDADSNALTATPGSENSVHNPDTAAPADASSTIATNGDTESVLSWTNPSDTDFFDSIILQSATSISDAPTNYTSYSVSDTIGSSTVIYAGSDQIFTATSLTNDTAYYFKVFTRDTVGNYSAGTEVSATPTAPDTTPPTDISDGSAAAGNTTADLGWVNPADDFEGILIFQGTSSISDTPTDEQAYSVSDTVGNSTVVYVGSDQAFTATILTNDTTYYFKIFAHDSAKNYSAGAEVFTMPAIITPSTGDVLINEIVTDPQTDWSTNDFDGTDGGETVSTVDEFVELYIARSGLDLTDWTIELLDGSDVTGDLTSAGAFDVANYSSDSGGSFTDTRLGDYLLLSNVDGSGAINNDVQIILKDNSDNTIDSVTLDGSTVPNGNASATDDEATARFPNASATWQQLNATLGITNSPINNLAVTAVSTDPNYPLADSSPTLTATIKNLGTATQSAYTLAFYSGDPNSGGILLNSENLTTNLDSLATTTVTYSWPNVSAGTYTIYARVMLTGNEANSDDIDSVGVTVGDHIVISELVPNPEDTDSNNECIVPQTNISDTSLS